MSHVFSRSRSLARVVAPLVLLCGAAGAGAAGVDAINGLWDQVDDDGTLHSLVRVETVDGQTQAVVVKGYPQPGKPVDPGARCTACPGELHDKPMVGLRFLWALKNTGKEAGREWDGGQILDPMRGNIYRAQATLSEDGSHLNVRGYLGMPMFGRSQVWRRHVGSAAD